MVETNKLKKLKEELKSYEDMVPVNNMGKWSRSVAIKSYKEKIENLETLIGFAGQFYSGSDMKEKEIFVEGFVEAVRVMGSLEQNEETEDLDIKTNETGDPDFMYNWIRNKSGK
jgi:tetrahydromethanopterin S-methyltransferase subunit F